MPLEANVDEVIGRAVKGLVEAGVTDPMAEFAAAVSACLLTLAAQIDRLRGELVTKGIEVLE